ncbi:ribbon-helix-helix protein, CopG family, partial [Shewanella indica]
MTDETQRFTVSLPQSLFEEIENDSRERGYQSRSEYIRDLFRDRIVDKQWNNS